MKADHMPWEWFIDVLHAKHRGKPNRYLISVGPNQTIVRAGTMDKAIRMLLTKRPNRLAGLTVRIEREQP